MPAACGHVGAVCVVGNYWECLVCDRLAELNAQIEAAQDAMCKPSAGARDAECRTYAESVRQYETYRADSYGPNLFHLLTDHVAPPLPHPGQLVTETVTFYLPEAWGKQKVIVERYGSDMITVSIACTVV